MTPPTANRWGGPAAVMAGLLWAAQGLIWTMSPKVQAETPPYAIIDRPLFALVWLSMVGAALCSAVALLGLRARQGGDTGAPGRASAVLAAVTIGVATVAGTATILATAGVAVTASLGVLSLALNGAALALLIALVFAAVATPRADTFPGWQRFLPAALAALTLLTLVAIAASGSRATAGLVAAIATVVASGATWLLLGWAVWPRPASADGRDRRPMPA